MAEIVIIPSDEFRRQAKRLALHCMTSRNTRMSPTSM